MDKDLSLALRNSLSKEVTSIATDFLEVGLDAVLEDGVLKDIPFVSSIVNLYKMGNTIKERHDIKKLATFVVALNNGIADEEERKYYIKAVQDNPSQRSKELEYIVIIINRYVQLNKAEMLAKLYLAYLDHGINWNTFSKASEVLDRFLPGDYQELEQRFWPDLDDSDVSDALLRLVSLGLVISHGKGERITAGTLVFPSPTLKDYELTSFGDMFLKCISS